MPMESNFSITTPINSSSLSVDEKVQCFLLDVNMDSTLHLFVAHILTLVLNLGFSIIAITGNLLVMFTVWKTPALHTPSNTFLCCLAFSDFAVGLAAQPCFVIHKIGELYQHFDMYCATRILLESLGNVTAGASVVTMTCIAFERYLALSLHLRYHAIVTARRILLIEACIWIFCIALVVMRLWTGNNDVYNAIAITLIFVSLLLTFLAYARILKCVRRHENRVKNLETGLERINPFQVNANRFTKMLHFKKSTTTLIYIVGVFVACYLPVVGVKVAHRVCGYTTSVKTAHLYASTLAFLNSSFNPLVYCWRMNALRQAAKRIVRQTFCKRSFSASKRKELPVKSDTPKIDLN